MTAQTGPVEQWFLDNDISADARFFTRETAAVEHFACAHDEADARKDEALRQAKESLEFYGDPETYFGIAMIGDPPHGDFFEDFDAEVQTDIGTLYNKPGKRARAAIAAIEKVLP